MTMASIRSTDPQDKRASLAGGAAADLLVDSRCVLGEGILWCDRRQVAWWTDIESSRLWRHRLADGQTRDWGLPDRVCSLALCESGRLLLGMAGGLYSLDVEGIDGAEDLRPEKWIDVPLAAPSVRVNDGRADRSGNFVFGTMNEAPDGERLGRFYQYSQGHGLRPLAIDGVAIANSICFGIDGRSMYYCDSRQGRILSCAYDARTASVGEPVVFAEVDTPASPDGAAVDRDGRLWSAQWGAGRIVRHGQDGRIDYAIEVPASNPSCLAFGGPALDRVLITTARVDLEEEELRMQPHAGGVYIVSIVGMGGLPENRFDDR